MQLQQQRGLAATILITAGVFSGIGAIGGYDLNFHPITEYCLPNTQCRRTDIVDARIFENFQQQAARRAEELAQRQRRRRKGRQQRLIFQSDLTRLSEDAQTNWETFAYEVGLKAEQARNIFSSASTKRFLDVTAEARFKGWMLQAYRNRDGHTGLRRILAGFCGICFLGTYWLLQVMEDEQPKLDLEATIDLEFHEKQYREQKQGASGLFAEGLAWNLAEAELLLREAFTGMTRRQLARLEEQLHHPQLPARQEEAGQGREDEQPALTGQSLDEVINPKDKINPQPQTKQLGQEDAKKQLWRLIEKHEGGWIKQILQRPILIYGDMGSYKSYFAAFLALCRHHLLGHELTTITDPHFHQNSKKAWKYLVVLGVDGLGAHEDYYAVGQGIRDFYDRCSQRTEEDGWLTSIFDEVTMYGDYDGSKKPSSNLLKKVLTAPRKSKEAPILIGHDDTLSALGGAEGVSGARDRGLIRLMLVSKTTGLDYEPLFRGFISGLKDENGKLIEDQSITIREDWIRPEYVYTLFNQAETDYPNPEPVPPDRSNAHPVLCPACSVPNPPDYRFCSACGSPLTPPEPPPEGGEKPSDLWQKAVRWLEQNWQLPLDSPTSKREVSDGQGGQEEVSEDEPDRGEVMSSGQHQPSGIVWTVRLVREYFPETTPEAFFASVSASARGGKKARDIIREDLKCREGREHPTRSYSRHGKTLFRWLIENFDDGSLASLPQIKEFLDNTTP